MSLEEHMMAEINYKYLPMYEASEPRDQSSGGVICKITICLIEAGIPMLGMK
jgi:hypothetical protein